MRSQVVVVETQDFSKVAVVGDLHGDYRTLQNLLKIVDLKADLLVFLGDYADRGPDGVEVIRTVAELQKKHSENVVALKGNHEDFTENGEPNFNPCTLVYEAEVKKGNWSHYFLEELKPFIDGLSLCCLISGNALLLHGGISGKLKGLEDLREPSDEFMMDLLWSDPKDGDGEEPNYSRGIGVEFGSDVSAAVCDSLGVKRIIRSHQPQMASIKPRIMHDGRVITVNTTSVYGGHPFIYFIDPKSTKKDYYQVI